MTGKGNFRNERWADVARPRLLADEMVGRLARYLRMLGCDTLYAHGWSDDEIVARARDDGRTVLTRDRALSSRVESAVLLRSSALPEQLRQVVAAIPDLPRTVSFERCTVCNGPLRPRAGPPGDPAPIHPRGPPAGPVFECTDCGHAYWEGTHTAAVRQHFAEWVGGVPS
jgi:uncharacterized protein